MSNTEDTQVTGDPIEFKSLDGFDEGTEEFTLNPNHKPICWSTSRADVADQCLYKYKRQYVDKATSQTKALALGSETHDVLAKCLKSRIYEPKDILAILDKKAFPDPELYKLVPHMSSFCQKYIAMCQRDNIEFTIEKKYGITRDMHMISFFSQQSYLRIIMDMWAYDEVNKRLIIMDHKTDKSPKTPDKVKEHEQLNLYVWALTKLFNLQWERAHVALHFVRHGKIVWAGISPEECDTFGKRYTAKLDVLENRVSHAEHTHEWPHEPGIYCWWCPYIKECETKCHIPQRKKKDEGTAEKGEGEDA